MNKRKDIVTNQKYERNQLIRISITKNGVTKIDNNYSLGGRGIYIHPDSINKVLESKILKANIKKFNGNYESIVQQLKEVCNGEKNK